jgi:hypothetical protein
VTPAYVIGYDPGGDGAHGLAALQVEESADRWVPVTTHTGRAPSLAAAVDWVQHVCGNGRLVSIGVDTLTEWSSDSGGWRAADKWLRAKYPAIARSIVAPNAIYGSMIMSGAGFLLLMSPRIRAERAMVTEAHPKAAYFALTGRRPLWSQAAGEMVEWLGAELGIPSPPEISTGADHEFDASVAALAALRGLNADWPLDLHALPAADPHAAVRYFGRTHYWWPG